MPKGPQGEKRPADVIGAAIMAAKIATGEIEEQPKNESAAAELGRKGGSKSEPSNPRATHDDCEEGGTEEVV